MMKNKEVTTTDSQSTTESIGEIVMYQPEGEVRLEVRVENETVWLNRQQLAILFKRDVKTIGKHISNALKEELKDLATVANFATVQKSVVEQNIRLSVVEQRIDFFVNAAQAPTGGILATGTRFDGLVLIADLVKSAKRSLVFIDPYATTEVLKFAAMRAKGVQAVIYSARITPEFKAAADLHKKQYPGLDLKTMRTIHDRFLLVDDKVYHFGASFKDMGNEMTAFSVLDFVTPTEVIVKIQESMKER